MGECRTIDAAAVEKAMRHDQALQADLLVFDAECEVHRAKLMLVRGVAGMTPGLLDESEAKLAACRVKSARRLARADVSASEIVASRRRWLREVMRQAETESLRLRLVKETCAEDGEPFGADNEFLLALNLVACESFYAAADALPAEDEGEAS